MGIAIIKAWKTKNSGWEFIYANKAFCDILAIKEDVIIGQDIRFMMPLKVAKNHDSFIEYFYNEGIPKFVGKLRVLFVKDYNGYISPIQFRLNFYYDPKFSYVFVAQMEKVSQFNLYKEESSKIFTKDAMIFICDNNLDITDHSKNLIEYS